MATPTQLSPVTICPPSKSSHSVLQIMDTSSLCANRQQDVHLPYPPSTSVAMAASLCRIHICSRYQIAKWRTLAPSIRLVCMHCLSCATALVNFPLILLRCSRRSLILVLRVHAYLRAKPRFAIVAYAWLREMRQPCSLNTSYDWLLFRCDQALLPARPERVAASP